MRKADKQRLGKVSALWLLVGSLAMGCGAGVEGEPTEVTPQDLATTEQHVVFNRHDYLFVTSSKTWEQAQTYCSLAGYHLVTINDAFEEAFLDEQENARAPAEWWIGYNDQGIEGTWVWSFGASNFVNWSPGEPNNIGNEDCAVDNNGLAGQWNDLDCNNLRFFICERESVPKGSRGTFFYAAANTESATVNTTQFAVFLFAGQLFTVGTCGVPGAQGAGDTFLRLNNPFGVEIAANDDAGTPCGLRSNLSIVAPTTGTYVIRAGCFGDTSCSGVVSFNY